MPATTATATATALAITGAGLSVFGINTGMHPQVLVAGCTGALWALSYQAPQPFSRRATVTALSAILSAYLTPFTVAMLQITAWLPGELALDLVQMPVAIIIGFLAHRKLGPAILKTTDRLVDKEPPTP